MSEKYISAAKLKAHYSWLGKDATLSPRDVDDIVDAQPAADVEPVVRARWMKHEDGDGVVCSHCGMWAAWCDPRLKTQHQSRYCPSCGCLMDMERSGDA